MVWVYNLLWFFPMDILKVAVKTALTREFSTNCWGVPELGHRGEGLAAISKTPKPAFHGAEGARARHIASVSLQLHSKGSLAFSSKMLQNKL